MSFGGDVTSFVKSTGIRLDLTMKKVCIDLTRDFAKATPVKTGLARSNFFFGYAPNSSVRTTANESGAPSVARAKELADGLTFKSFYITNNLPYILKILEYGTSDQMAPGGLSRIVARWQAIVDGAAAGSREARVQEFKGVSE